MLVRRLTFTADARPGPLPAAEVHVWACPLPAASPFLSDDERARAARYRSDEARVQFAGARSALRQLLGGYLGCDPLAVSLSANAEGKPCLADLGAAVEFNVSHTHGLALVAVAAVPVGVDVEHLRPVRDAAGLVDRYFSPEERAEFAALPEQAREGALWRGWTAKEAVLKGIGCGLRDLDRCVVRLNPDAPAAILGPDATRAGWRLLCWEPSPGHLAALGVGAGEELTAD